MKVHYSDIDKRIIRLFLLFFIIKYVFHIRVFYKYRHTIPFESDLNNELEQYGLPLFDIKSSKITQLYVLCWAFEYDPYFLTLYYSRLNDCHLVMRLIHPDNSSFHIYSPIGKNIRMHHPFSTILNARKIGDNFTVKNNVTIGNKNDDNTCKPTIGDNVYISSNVVVFGNITIGNNVVIGAGAVVNKDVPDNCIVVGNPMRIIKRG